MKNTLMLILSTALILASGCSTLHKSDSASLQGTWQGRAVGDEPAAPCSFVIAGNNFEFHGPDAKVWYKGTFTLREDTKPKQYIAVITDCPFPQYVGKTSMAIYRLENGNLTITGNEPGKPTPPAAFDAPGAARVELKRK